MKTLKTKTGRVFTLNTPAEDAAITAAALADFDARPYTDAEWAQVKPTRGRPPLLNPKRHINLRIDEAIVEAFQASGKGWQTRMNDALKDWLKTHPLPKH